MDDGGRVSRDLGSALDEQGKGCGGGQVTRQEHSQKLRLLVCTIRVGMALHQFSDIVSLLLASLRPGVQHLPYLLPQVA